MLLLPFLKSLPFCHLDVAAVTPAIHFLLNLPHLLQSNHHTKLIIYYDRTTEVTMYWSLLGLLVDFT